MVVGIIVALSLMAGGIWDGILEDFGPRGKAAIVAAVVILMVTVR